MRSEEKDVYIIAGANGSGKTTAAMTILPDFLAIEEFVNADNIASGLSPLNPDGMAVTAGKLMIERIKTLIKNKKSFAFETTLSGRSHIRTIKECKKAGYEPTLIFLWLPNYDLAIRRVESRVKQGGHNIPTKTIIRRYKSCLCNLVEKYIDICDNVTVYDNSEFIEKGRQRDIIARKIMGEKLEIINVEKWQQILRVCNDNTI